MLTLSKSAVLREAVCSASRLFCPKAEPSAAKQSEILRDS